MFAEKVRDHKELETRWAVLQEARVEYFRGKDFITLLRAHPELIKPLGIEAAIEDVELDIGNILIRRKLIVRCDRVTKTPRPGKTKLSKWPARIEIFPVSLSLPCFIYMYIFLIHCNLFQSIQVRHTQLSMSSKFTAWGVRWYRFEDVSTVTTFLYIDYCWV